MVEIKISGKTLSDTITRLKNHQRDLEISIKVRTGQEVDRESEEYQTTTSSGGIGFLHWRIRELRKTDDLLKEFGC